MKDPMNYRLLFLLLFPAFGMAQGNLTGLGRLRIGLTTPDSLNRTAFREENKPLVKGTIALPCDHIRLFTAMTMPLDGVDVSHVVLLFYDDRLFRISCDFSDGLDILFVRQFGPGIEKPARRVRLCSSQPNALLTVAGRGWTNGDVEAVGVRVTGYSADCRTMLSDRLTIVSRRYMALSSDCELPADSFADVLLHAPD